jgi:hypothetical protein
MLRVDEIDTLRWTERLLVRSVLSVIKIKRNSAGSKRMAKRVNLRQWEAIEPTIL